MLVFAVAAAALSLGGHGDALLPGPRLLTGDNARLVAPVTLGTQGGAPALEPQGAAAEGESATRPAAVYFEHEVAEGESLGSIAEAYGLGVDYLIWNNPEVAADPDYLLIGEKLMVPGTEGIVYDVRLGDTITDIAAVYGIDAAAVVEFGPNNLTSPDLIIEGMVLVLPGGVPPPPPAPVLEEPEAADDVGPAPGGGISVPVGVAVAAPAPSIGFIWPVNGTFWSGFGPRWGSFHKGIDIGAAYGTGVAAAATGQVILAVYRDNGYGNYIIVRHADGTETLYAHLSAMYVSQGQEVGQGEIIGAVGCTGWCNGDHLHFEIYVGGTPVDPMLYLP